MRMSMSKAEALGFLVGFGLILGLPAGAEELSGQVSQDVDSYPGAVTKSMTMTPGAGTFSADHLRFGRQVAITLYNPNDYPMRFDTVQRIGKEYSWIVPPNSSRTVAFRYFNPVSDEVRFLSYQDPDSLQISQGTVSQRQAASNEPTESPETTADNQEMNQPETQAQEPSQTESQSAVRGYW